MKNNTEFLKYIPMFSELDDEALDKIAEIGISKKYTEDSVILFEKDSGSAVFIIIEGKVKVFRFGADGKEVIISILGEYNIFGEMSLFDGQGNSAHVTAMEDTSIFIINHDDFFELLKKQPKVTFALLQEMSKRLRNANVTIKSLSLNDAESRVACVLVQLADEPKDEFPDTGHIKVLPYQHDIAKLAGTSRETVSRALQMFEKKGLIESNGSGILIRNYGAFKSAFL